jgi:predicted amidohydrolase YtcJ
VVEADQSITLDEALGLYTRDAASAAGCPGDCGTLETGKRADLVVLDRRLKESELDAVRVRATLVGGDVAFGSVS